jgi:DNA repair protein RecO (recombination protein O)
MAILKTQAFVLKRYDLRETSLLVNFYTRDFGKLTGEMKGIRKDPRKFASTVDSFSLNEIVFYQRRNSSVHLISQCDSCEHFGPLRESMPKIAVATVMMDLLDAVMPPEDKNPEIFDLTRDVLTALCTARDFDKLLTIFKIRVLSLSGFKPHLDSCVICGRKVFMQCKFSLKLGGLLCPHCLARDVQGRTIFRGTVATIMHIEKNTVGANLTLGMNPQIKRELEAVLNAFLHFHVGKELKSQRVMQSLEQAGAFT